MTPRTRAASVAAFGAVCVAMIGGLATEIGPWYLGLKQPPWKPPDVWFGPAWSVIYACTAAACALAWLHAPTRAARRGVLLATLLNAVLNVVWSLTFFRFRRPDWALAEVLALWLSIVLMMAVFARHSRLGALLLLPYLAWVGFAGALNAAVVQLNGPFGKA